MALDASERFGSLIFYGFILLLAYLVYRVFSPFLVPLGWASVFAVLFYSWNKRFERAWGRTASAAVSTAGVTIILIVPVLVLMLLFVREGIDATRQIQQGMLQGQFGWLSHAWLWLMARAPLTQNVDIPGLVRQGASRLGEFLAAELGAVLRNIVIFLFQLFVTLFALFYFFRDGDALLERIRRLMPFEPRQRERMLEKTHELIFATVIASLVVASAQGLICGAAFAIVGLPSALFWGILMAFLSLLPVVGAWPVWVPAGIWLFSTGHSVRAIVLLSICAGLGSTVEHFLRPILLSGRARLNGLLVFIGVLGGIAVFGVLGVVLGPIVVATAVGILEGYSRQTQAQPS